MSARFKWFTTRTSHQWVGTWARIFCASLSWMILGLKGLKGPGSIVLHRRRPCERRVAQPRIARAVEVPHVDPHDGSCRNSVRAASASAVVFSPAVCVLSRVWSRCQHVVGRVACLTPRPELAFCLTSHSTGPVQAALARPMNLTVS